MQETASAVGGRRTADGRYVARRALPTAVGAARFAGAHARGGFPVVLEVPADDGALGRAVRALADLRHPTHVRLLDVSTLDGARCLVLEHVEGATLAEALRAQRRLSPPRAHRIALDLVAGLAELHGLGRAHGDVRPEHVLVPMFPSGDVRAKLRGHGGRPRAGDARVAPELRPGGGDADATADVWALGALLHEALSGRPPDPAAEAPPPLGALVPVPSRLADVVAWATRPDPATRPASAHELLGALAALDPDEIARFELHVEGAGGPRAGALAAAEEEDAAPLALLTGTPPSLWVLAPELVARSAAVREALDELAGRAEVRHVAPEERAGLAEALRDERADPPWVVLFDDVTVRIDDPLLAALARERETARLLVSAQPDADLTRRAVEALGLDQHVVLPAEPRALVRAAEHLLERALGIRRHYDALRLAVRDAHDDLAALERRGAAPDPTRAGGPPP